MNANFLVSFIIAAGLLGGSVWCAVQPREYEAVRIKASTDVPENGLPVYAQFIVTQTLQLSEATLISGLAIPMHVSKSTPVVRLSRNKHEVAQWSVPAEPISAGTHTLKYYFAEPKLLDGDIEVQIDGSAVSYEEKDSAPRIFIETADVNYPNGNYRIAQNEKQGDMAVSLLERRYVWQDMLAHVRKNPAGSLGIIVPAVLLCLLFITLPYLFVPNGVRLRQRQ